MKLMHFFFGLMAILLLVSCHQKKRLDEAEITQIAKEAYIYGYPVIGLYRDMYVRAIDREGARFLKPFNELAWRSLSSPVVPAAEKSAMETGDESRPAPETGQLPGFEASPSKMAYGSVWFNLQDEPCVLVVPPTLAGRYFSIQFVDLFSETFDYISNRKDGNKGGHYLIAASGWQGGKPAGIRRTIDSRSSYVLGLFRIGIESRSDLKNVEKLMTQFSIIPLSQYDGRSTGREGSVIHYPEFSPEKAKTPEFFAYLNFMLQFCSIPEEEGDLLTRFARIGIEPGKPFDYSDMPETEKKALVDGMAAGYAELQALGRSGSGRLRRIYGTEEKSGQDYPYRAYMTDRYFFGRSPEEILTVVYETEPNRKRLDSGKGYELLFDAHRLPPVDAFWTLSAHSLAKEPSFKPNNTYVLNSASHVLELNADGSLVVFVQQEMPGPEKRNNWLPVPSGPFFILLQLYQPGEEVLNGEWAPPEIRQRGTVEEGNTTLPSFTRIGT